MQFNSWQFAMFFAVVYALYLAMGHKKQNHLLLVSSYLFYSVWDWRFSFLLLFSTIVDYGCGIAMDRSATQSRRRLFLAASLTSNLGILGFFKYFNFFISSAQALLDNLGIHTDPFLLKVILPVGVSFYTFQSLSYTIDVYRRKMPVCLDFFDFATFISFFPQLVAGPIERAHTLIKQVQTPRSIKMEEVRKGAWLVFWGLWKKVFVADNLARLVDGNFSATQSLPFPLFYVTLIAFSFQIYCDFSGYTDIARGISKLMGFDLMRNFNLPYFAENPSDFWKRWHISLSSWLRDYLYISLGGNRNGKLKTYRNLLLTMVLGGIWHGASWNFLLWGIYHGLLLAGYHYLSERFRIRINKWAAIAIMYQFTLLGWLLFRATGSEAFDGTVHTGMQQIGDFFASLTHGPAFDARLASDFRHVLFFVLPLVALEALQYLGKDQYFVMRMPTPAAAAIKALMLFTILRFGVQIGESFIYFQF